MRLLLILVAVLVIAALPSSPASAAGCSSIQLGGQGYVFYKQGVSCKFGKRAVKRLVRSGGDNAPRGFKCSSGSNYRSGGRCLKRGDKQVYFGWHPGD